MTWHLRPSGYAAMWILMGCGYVLFQLWKPEIAAHREAVTVFLVVVIGIVVAALYGL